MEANQLIPSVLLFVLVGMMVGVGVLALDKTANAAKVSSNVVDETVVVATGTATATYDDWTALTDFANINGSISEGNFTKNVDVNWTVGGVIVVNRGKITDGNANLTYTYDADTTATTTLQAGRDEVGKVATVWLGLVITILILAIIITLVVKSFGNPGDGR